MSHDQTVPGEDLSPWRVHRQGLSEEEWRVAGDLSRADGDVDGWRGSWDEPLRPLHGQRRLGVALSDGGWQQQVQQHGEEQHQAEHHRTVTQEAHRLAGAAGLHVGQRLYVTFIIPGAGPDVVNSWTFILETTQILLKCTDGSWATISMNVMLIGLD